MCERERRTSVKDQAEEPNRLQIFVWCCIARGFEEENSLDNYLHVCLVLSDQKAFCLTPCVSLTPVDRSKTFYQLYKSDSLL